MQSMDLWESSNGKWTIRVTLVSKNHRTYMIVGEANCDYPVVYEDGSVGYDFPELLPQYVKDKMEQIALALEH